MKSPLRRIGIAAGVVLVAWLMFKAAERSPKRNAGHLPSGPWPRSQVYQIWSNCWIEWYDEETLQPKRAFQRGIVARVDYGNPLAPLVGDSITPGSNSFAPIIQFGNFTLTNIEEWLWAGTNHTDVEEGSVLYIDMRHQTQTE